MACYLKRKIRTILSFHIFVQIKKEHLAFRQICKIIYQKSGQKTTFVNYQSRKNR